MNGVLEEEKILQIMAVSGIDYDSASHLLASVGGGRSAEKILIYLRHGLSVEQIRLIHKRGLLVYDPYAIAATFLSRITT